MPNSHNEGQSQGFKTRTVSGTVMGEVQHDGPIIVKGTVMGNVVSKSWVIIEGEVIGNVNAQESIVVDGTLIGHANSVNGKIKGTGEIIDSKTRKNQTRASGGGSVSNAGVPENSRWTNHMNLGGITAGRVRSFNSNVSNSSSSVITKFDISTDGNMSIANNKKEIENANATTIKGSNIELKVTGRHSIKNGIVTGGEVTFNGRSIPQINGGVDLSLLNPNLAAHFTGERSPDRGR